MENQVSNCRYLPTRQQNPGVTPALVPKAVFSLIEKAKGPSITRSSVHSDDQEIDMKKIEELTKLTLSPNDLFQQDFKLSHSKLQLSSSQEKIEKLLFTLQLKPFKYEEKVPRVPADVICVLDVSGSMAGDKMELLKRSLKQLIFKFLSPEDRISVIIFSSTALSIFSWGRISEENKKKLGEIVDELDAGGGTNITSGMKLAFDALKRRTYQNTVSSIFLLSDGQDGSAISGVESLLGQRDLEKSFIINTFGYGNDHDPQLMDKIARLGNGNFYPIEKLDDLDRSFVDALGSSISVKGLDVCVEIESVTSNLFPSIAIRKGFGGEEMWNKINETYKTKEVHLSTTKHYVLEIAIPKCDKKLKDHEKVVTIAKATVTLRLPTTKDLWKSEHELTIELLNEDENFGPEYIVKDVFKEYYRVCLAKKLKMSLTKAENGDYIGAKTILKEFKDELSRSVVKDEQFIKIIEQQTDDNISQIKPEIFKVGGKHRLYQKILSYEKEKSSTLSDELSGQYTNQTQKILLAQLEEIKTQEPDETPGPLNRLSFLETAGQKLSPKEKEGSRVGKWLLWIFVATTVGFGTPVALGIGAALGIWIGAAKHSTKLFSDTILNEKRIPRIFLSRGNLQKKGLPKFHWVEFDNSGIKSLIWMIYDRQRLYSLIINIPPKTTFLTDEKIEELKKIEEGNKYKNEGFCVAIPYYGPPENENVEVVFMIASLNTLINVEEFRKKPAATAIKELQPNLLETKIIKARTN